MGFEGEIGQIGLRNSPKQAEAKQISPKTDEPMYNPYFEEKRAYKRFPKEYVVIQRGVGWQIFSWVCLFFLLILGGLFAYLAYDGYFKSSINQDVSFEPQINESVNVANSYQFTPQTNNVFYQNFTIIVRNSAGNSS